MEVGDKLNPQRSFRKGFALKGIQQHIIKKKQSLYDCYWQFVFQILKKIK